MRSIHSIACFTIIAIFLVLTSADAFVATVPSKRTTRRSAIKAGLNTVILQKSHAVITVATAAVQTTVVAPATIGTIVAKALGYVIGVGSLAVYLPIVVSLLKKQSSDGFSVATWVFNLMGITLAVLYPLKKGFPMSTFVELLIMVIQSTGILGTNHLTIVHMCCSSE